MENDLPDEVQPNAEEDASQEETQSSSARKSDFKPFSGLSVGGAIHHNENPRSRTIAQLIFVLFIAGLCLYVWLS
jgi:hypothetical protein